MDDLLLSVKRPAQYIGREWNVSKKNFDQAGVRFALSFPDLYEVGMSNLGLRIIYGILNDIPDVACERVFSPDVDMEAVLRSSGESLRSLESQKALADFDLLGFSLGSELCYTNILNILDLGKIPLKASQRSAAHPVIIGGGPCSLNPEPLSDFFDLFIIGEAEEAIVEIADLYRQQKTAYKSGKITKQSLLESFCGIEGVYLPSFYEVKGNSEGLIDGFRPNNGKAPEKIKKRIIKDLDASFFPVNWMVPYIQIIHDRITLEIMRGCPNRCRFCQARSQYYPLRIRKYDTLLNLAKQAYRNTGYEEISLGGLSVSDHPEIEKISCGLLEAFQGQAVSVSLPSIKAHAHVGSLSTSIAGVKKTGLTFAPEAGSQRLRDLLQKDFKEEDFFKILSEAYAAGYQRVKLYFMIGLPTENQEDLDAIAEFSRRVSDERRKSCNRPAEVNISINALIPKPHTAFQWFAMESLEKIEEKYNYLKTRIKSRHLKLNFHNRQMSILEGILSRGDRRLGRVIMDAFSSGAKFDAWSDHFDFQKWLDAFNKSGIEPDAYLKQRTAEAVFPWDFLDTGVGKTALRREYDNTIES